ncbi:MAG: P27 family phage terminase small subunit [Caldimonas sp.]
MNVIEGTGEIVIEPDWSAYTKLPIEKSQASEHWRAVTSDLRSRNILSAGNTHAIVRLVLTYIVYDRAAAEAAKSGMVLKPKRGNPKAIARVSPHYTVMKEAASTAASMETELGLSPRHRNSAAPVQKRADRRTGADAYLKPRSA